MRKRPPRDSEKEAQEQAALLKAWRAWHAEQLEQAIAGPHGVMVAKLMALLDQLELDSAAVLLDFMRHIDWGGVDHNTRFELLHRINQAIERVRVRAGLPPIDDPLPHQPDNVFRRIKSMLFPPSPANAGSEFSGQRSRPVAAYSGQSSDEEQVTP